MALNENRTLHVGLDHCHFLLSVLRHASTPHQILPYQIPRHPVLVNDNDYGNIRGGNKPNGDFDHVMLRLPERLMYLLLGYVQLQTSHLTHYTKTRRDLDNTHKTLFAGASMANPQCLTD